MHYPPSYCPHIYCLDFSSKLWVNSWTDWDLLPWYDNQLRRRKYLKIATSCTLLKNLSRVASCPCEKGGTNICIIIIGSFCIRAISTDFRLSWIIRWTKKLRCPWNFRGHRDHWKICSLCPSAILFYHIQLPSHRSDAVDFHEEFQIYIPINILLLTCIKKGREKPRDVRDKVLECILVVNDFELQSRYYVLFRPNTSLSSLLWVK